MNTLNKSRYEKYVDKFFEVNKPKEQGTYKSLFNKLEYFDKFITEWKIEDLEEFIKKTGSISVNSINKFLQYSKTLYEFICKENNIVPKHLYLPKDLKFYIDMGALNDVTLTEMQYKFVKNLLTVQTIKGQTTSRHEYIQSGEYNFRDKVLWMLPWEAGLTNQEIKNLRIDNIEFYEEYGKQKARLKLKDRKVVITNLELIESIKKTIDQNVYYRIESQAEKSGREYFVYLKSTPMVIRPIQMRQSNLDTVANPSMLLGRALVRLEAEHDIPHVSLSKISIEDIRRSRIIHFLKDPAYSIDDVKNMFGRQNESDLYWLMEIAQVFKKKEEELKNKK